MAAFRKMFLAVASVAAFAAIPASAQAFQPFNCTVTANAPLVRYQGLTEEVGDILLSCTGGTPTPLGSQVPVNNFALSIQSTNITSQVLPANLPVANGGYPYSEAILAINEPASPAPNPTGALTPTPYNAVQQPCPASNTGTCFNTGDGTGGFSTYSIGGNFNLFQGYQFDKNTLRFDGIPLDPPGAGQNITIRISNVRVDATPFAGSASPITATLSITGTQPVAINNINPYVVGYAANGIKWTANGNSESTCTNTPGRSTVAVQEGFASSFKRRTYFADGITSPNPPPGGVSAGTGSGIQNILGYPYFSESGYYDPSLTWVSPGLVGLATQGTRVWVNLTNIQNTLTVTAPTYVSLIGGAPIGGGLGGPDPFGSGVLKLVGTDAAGAGYFASGVNSFTSSADGSAVAFVYEVLYSDPSAIETATIDFSVAYTTSSMYTVPPTYIQGSAQLAPVSTTPAGHLAQVVVGAPTADSSIPRFVASPGTPENTFFLTGCQCDLLFPYVVSQNGLETGIAISNTSADPYGTAPQSGYVQLFYYPNHASSFVPPASFFTTPPATITAQTAFTQTTATQVTSGGQLLMVAGSGSSNPGETIKGVPGFNGYLIAVTGFQYCHAFAFISDTQVQKLAEGYLAVLLDQPKTLERAGGPSGYAGIAPPNQVNGESLGH